MDWEFYFPDDHETCWAGDGYMLEQTKRYAQQARGLSIRMLLAGCRYPWIDGDIPRCVPRLRIFELGDHDGRSDINQTQSFKSARDLYSYLKQEPGVDERGGLKLRRRLIILDDVDPRFAEVLGVVLKIPAAFFVAHCNNYDTLSVVDHTYAKKSSSRYWKLQVPQRRVIPHDVPEDGPFELLTGNFLRRWNLENVNAQGIRSYFSQLSYWGQEDGGGSWTAVLLVDPQRAYLRSVRESPRNLDQKLIYLEYIECNEPEISSTITHVMVDPPSTDTTTLNERSIYDFLVKTHQNCNVTYTDDPFSATIYTRNFICAVLEGWIALNSGEAYQMVYESLDREDDSLEAMKHQDRRIIHRYQKLMDQRHNINVAIKIVKSTLWAFGARDEHLHPSKSADDANARNGVQIEKQSDTLRRCEEKLNEARVEISQHIDEYAQRAALSESYATNIQTLATNRQTAAANRQARSASQLTKIATVVVPSTVVASIFSMGGDFAAGEKLFPIYWAISLPITVVLLAWVLHGDILYAWWMLKGIVALCVGRENEGSRALVMETEEGKLDARESKRGWRRKLLKRRKGGDRSDVEMGMALDSVGP